MKCAEHRARALDFVLGDLPALERVRMEAHLDRCDECLELVVRLRNAFQEAKQFPPELGKIELETLIGRLEPYYAREAQRGGYGRMIFAAAAITALIAFGLTSSLDVQEEEETTPELVKTKVQVPPFLPEIVSLEPRPFVRLVAGSGWDGKVSGENAHSTSIVMSRGFAVIDFAGGDGRKLWVGAPNVSIEVVGTRFFVDTAPSGRTTIGVVAGRVVVSNAEGRVAIHAGETKSFGGEAPKPRSDAERFTDDPFLGRGTTAAAAPATAADREKTPAELDPLAELAAAERLARLGDPRGALAKYDTLLARAGESSTILPLIRYERARLLTFVLGDRERGLAELNAVAASERGEASVQAKLSLCEAQLADDRCAAARCLETLRVREHDALSTEIDRLFERWKLSCDHN